MPDLVQPIVPSMIQSDNGGEFSPHQDDLYTTSSHDFIPYPDYSTTPIQQLPTVPHDELCNLTEAQARREMDLLLDQARTSYENPFPVDGQGSCTQHELSQALRFDQWIPSATSLSPDQPLTHVNMNTYPVHFLNNSGLSRTKFGTLLTTLNNSPSSLRAFSIRPRQPVPTLIAQLAIKFPALLAAEMFKFPSRQMHNSHFSVCGPLLKHVNRLQHMVHIYPTVSTADRPTIQWAISLQAAMVQAYARVLVS
jgi:hypothetical protein